MDADTHSVMKHNCIVCELVLPEIQTQNDRLKLENRNLSAEVERLKTELHDTIDSYKLNNLQPKTTRPEPSRLEIAAQIYAAWWTNPQIELLRQTGNDRGDCFDRADALEEADALIAAAKEAK